MTHTLRRRLFALLLVATGIALSCRPAAADATETLVLRGRPQTLRLYGTRGQTPVIVSSGDGGWVHLGPDVATYLAGRGFFVVGFDTRAYLASFTSGKDALHADDVPTDYKALADFAFAASGKRPILIGVSEGAGLSVLAATAPATRSAISGVIGLGLPRVNELGWRWRDSLIYLTHGVPNEPTFETDAVIGRAAPTPIAIIQSTHDEFVPLSDVQRVVGAATGPNKLWVVDAVDHRFSNNLADFNRRLLEAIAWVGNPDTVTRR